MNWVKGFALVMGLAAPLSLSVATRVSADPALAATPVASDAMSVDAKKAKAADCSRQADAKKLHGEARKKFRSACKKM